MAISVELGLHGGILHHRILTSGHDVHQLLHVAKTTLQQLCGAHSRGDPEWNMGRQIPGSEWTGIYLRLADDCDVLESRRGAEVRGGGVRWDPFPCPARSNGATGAGLVLVGRVCVRPLHKVHSTPLHPMASDLLWSNLEMADPL